MTIRTVIVDDEPLARERVRTLLAGHADFQVVAECFDGEQAVAAVREHTPDLLFLDVQMPEMDGLHVLEQIGENPPLIVFVTTYDQYAIRAFEVHALDYLLKPFDRQRFEKTLDRVRKELDSGRGGQIQQKLTAILRDLKRLSGGPRRFLVQSGGRVHFVRADEIDWIRAEGNYVRLQVGSESYLVRDTMAGMEAKLDPERFVRIHRSTIVNLDRVKELHPLFRGEHQIILRDGTRLTLSRGYRDRLKKLL